MARYVRSGAVQSVNTQTAGDQARSAVAGLAGGNYVIVWQTDNAGQDGSFGAIKAQIYAASGAPIGSEFLVNTATADDQLKAKVAALPSGGFVVTWETADAAQDGSGTALKGQLFDSAGAKVGAEFRINALATANQQQPAIAGTADGGFVVAWHTTDTSQDGSSWAVKAQKFSASGTAVGAEFLVNTVAIGAQYNVDVAALSSGGYVVTWQTGNASDAEIYARVYKADGTAAGAQFLVSDDHGSQTEGRVAGLTGGGFAVAWMTSDTSGLGVRGAVFDSNSVKIGTEFAVNTSQSGNQIFPDVVALTDGNFVVAWENSGLADGLTLQAFSPTGVKLGGEVVIASDPAVTETQLSLAALSGGGFVASWAQTSASAGYEVRAQRFVVDPTANAAPELGAATRSIPVAENGTTVATFAATDDTYPYNLTYWIVGGADAAKFTIVGTTGQLRFSAAPDYEAPTDSDHNNVYEVVVLASDGELSDTQAVSVSITNVNEAPVITSNGAGNAASILLPENGTAVTIVRATDPENTPLVYSIYAGVDAARFTIDSATGVLTFIAAPDFEAPTDSDHNNSYVVFVKASDGSLIDTQAITVAVTNVNEAPAIGSSGGGDTAALTVAENGVLVGTVAATDPEHAAIAYSISGGADAAHFAIEPSSGVLTFVAAPDYEWPTDANADNVYEVTVRASDGTFADTQALSVTVSNIVENIAITSDGGGDTAFVGLDENGIAVTTVTAANGEAGPVTYAIAGGADAALFGIDSASGALVFLAAPDFEAPADADFDGVYDVIVSADNGAFTDTQTLAVTVFDVAESEGGKPSIDPRIGPVYIISPEPLADLSGWHPA
jgi:Cadherin domain